MSQNISATESRFQAFLQTKQKSNVGLKYHVMLKRTHIEQLRLVKGCPQGWSSRHPR